MKNNLIYKLVDKFLMNDFSKIISKKLEVFNEKEPIIFDVGCFLGNFSRSLKKKLNNKAKFYLFDPNPNLKLKDFNTIQLAISDSTGNQNYNLNTFFPASGSSLNEIIKNDKLWNFTRKLITGSINKNFITFPVKTSTLDNFCNENDVKNITILKIDVEGSELKVLNGAREILKNTKLIQIEILDTKKKYTEKYLAVKDLLENQYNFKLIKEKKIWSLGMLSNMKAVDALFMNFN